MTAGTGAGAAGQSALAVAETAADPVAGAVAAETPHEEFIEDASQSSTGTGHHATCYSCNSRFICLVTATVTHKPMMVATSLRPDQLVAFVVLQYFHTSYNSM